MSGRQAPCRRRRLAYRSSWSAPCGSSLQCGGTCARSAARRAFSIAPCLT